MRFKDWLNKIDETGTSTSCIASFPRMTIPLVRRIPDELGGTWPDKKQKKKGVKQQPQLKESSE